MKLQRRQKKRLDAILEVIRKELLIDHWIYSYDITDQDDDSMATNYTPELNNRIWIHIHKPFWTCDFEQQITTLIHEHVHAIHNEFTQAIVFSTKYASRDSYECIERMRAHADEHITDHLTAILFPIIWEKVKCL